MTTDSTRMPEAATVVITHRVCHDKHDEYERWMVKIMPVAKAAPGHLDWQLIRPISGLSETFTIVLRFDSRSNLQRWMQSPQRAALIDEVRPLLVNGDDFYISSGLDFWFTPGGAKAQLPVRWKQFLLTWSAIFPLVLFNTWLVSEIFALLGLSAHPVVTTLILTALVVFLMIYVVMPRYTKLVHRWLFK